MRFLYNNLLRMHPPEFRGKFSAEMLLIFDEAGHSEGFFVLLLDCLVSLFRQWLLRSGLWKLIPAIACALLQMAAFGFLLPQRSSRAAASFGNAPIGLAQVVVCGAAITVVLIATTALGVSNVRRLGGRSTRTHDRQSGVHSGKRNSI